MSGVGGPICFLIRLIDDEGSSRGKLVSVKSVNLGEIKLIQLNPSVPRRVSRGYTLQGCPV